MPDPLPLTDEHLLDQFHPVAKALSGLEYSELWDVQIFAYKGRALHVTQSSEGSPRCLLCQDAIQCPGILYLLANEVRF